MAPRRPRCYPRGTFLLCGRWDFSKWQEHECEMSDNMSDTPSDLGAAIDRLAGIMAKLRDPETGCPWDVEQDFTTIAPYTIEEAHEVADAIARNDMADL